MASQGSVTALDVSLLKSTKAGGRPYALSIEVPILGRHPDVHATREHSKIHCRRDTSVVSRDRHQLRLRRPSFALTERQGRVIQRQAARRTTLHVGVRLHVGGARHCRQPSLLLQPLPHARLVGEPHASRIRDHVEGGEHLASLTVGGPMNGSGHKRGMISSAARCTSTRS